ncbi:MAG: hypothetical protein HYV96_21105 [Opitutae bacterium]|nr:hypothetical protein [Opitutae bacterium]
MNSTSPSLFAKILAATIGFGLMAAVPLLTMQYAARAHAEPTAPAVANHPCPRTCPAEVSSCPPSAAACAKSKSSCAAGRCLAH